MPRHLSTLAAGIALVLPLFAALATPSSAQERLPWQNRGDSAYEPRDSGRDDPDRRADQGTYDSRSNGRDYSQDYGSNRSSSTGNAYGGRANDAYSPPPRAGGYPSNDRAYGEAYRAPAEPYERNYGSAYPADRSYESGPRRDPGEHRDGTYSADDISTAGHRFFGKISKGMASAIEYVFKRQGRPNGYILGEDAGGAFVAGLRYGEGVLHTRDAGQHKVFWQGPSLGYDFGGEGSKVMVLVYNLRDPSEIFDRFGGVAGSAYVVGGVGLTFQAKDHIVLAPIRAGVGLRLGANIGYLKFTPRATWNPF